MEAKDEIAPCQWCRGDGKDHGTLGMATVRECPRCRGSGGVFVTSRDSVSGRRRVYKGPAPKPGVTAARQQQELTALLKQAHPRDWIRRGRDGRFVKHG